MTRQDSNWKKHLQRTSVPLEHDAAKILSKAGFLVSANYPYFRRDNGVEKEFSVDIRCVRSEETERFGVGCVLDVLVECKYRDEGTTWLFLPYPSDRSKHVSEVIQYVDLFSPWFVHGSRSYNASDESRVCYSAIEVGSGGLPDGESKGRAIESQLRHGARQLQYALPALAALRARWLSRQKPDENYPFFFLPILVTNARLMIAHGSFGLRAVEDADTLDDVGTPVSRVVWSAELGPDFNIHCQQQFAELPAIVQSKHIQAVEAQRRAAGLADWLQPSAVASRLNLPDVFAGDIAEFTGILVVTIDSLATVIEMVSRVFVELAKSVKREPLFRG
jgi:hypothetical protein